MYMYICDIPISYIMLATLLETPIVGVQLQSLAHLRSSPSNKLFTPL